nr:MAG TPA: head to tail adaptor [Caudoviricetes sp.]
MCRTAGQHRSRQAGNGEKDHPEKGGYKVGDFMIMTVEELRQFIQTDEPDAVLSFKLEALENIVQKRTNNNFHDYEVDGVIIYPPDIKLGVVNLMKWELESRDKLGIQSETISRHSVTYADATGDSYIMGYPKALMGFLKPYMKARF